MDREKGFYYDVDIEKIKEYIKIPDEMKLKWLDEIFKFTIMCDTEKSKKVREMIRKGDI